MTDYFAELGIEPTRDARAIKDAYRGRLTAVNPEENPEGFKRLRAAYEEACAYAARTGNEDSAEAERDTTPSGLWVERAGQIYARLSSRKEPGVWSELFADDVFLSLEEEENCRDKLLRFLMEHHHLPAAVWKLLDEKLCLTRDARRLRERFQVDFINFVLAKCERGEEISFEYFEGEEDAPYDLFLNYYEQCRRALQEGNTGLAREVLEKADLLHIFHPALEVTRANLLTKQQKPEEALQILEGLLERFPKDDMVRYNAAEAMWGLEQRERAAAIYEELVEENKCHYMANYRLAEWYCLKGEYKKAKKCAENVLRMGAEDDFLEILAGVNGELEKEYQSIWERDRDWDAGMELGWCMLQDGKISRGIRLALELGGQKDSQPPEKRTAYDGLLTKLYVEAVEYESALYMAGIWEKALEGKIASGEDEEEQERDRDRIRQSHLIRIQCCRRLGWKDGVYFIKAIEEISSLESGTSKDIPLLLEKAQIYLDMKEYELCLGITDRLIAEYGVYAANAAAMSAWRRKLDAGGVIRCAGQCIAYYPDYARAYECAAEVYRDLGYTGELKSILEKAEQNGVESPILEAYRYQMSHASPKEGLDGKLEQFRRRYTERLDEGEMGCYGEGLPILTEYLYQYPGAYMLRERGLFHLSGRHYAEALADFEKSLEEDPANPYALRGMALTYLRMGDCENALRCMKHAVLYLGDDAWPDVYVELARIYSLLGDYEMARKTYGLCEADVRKDRHAGYMVFRIAETLARCGRPEEAYAGLDSYYENGNPLEKYRYLTELCQITGWREKAEDLLRKWEKLLRTDHRRRALKRIADRLFPNSERSSGTLCCGRNYEYYYERRGWHELMYGECTDAIRYFVLIEKGRELDRKANGEESAVSADAGICDVILACILAGDEQKGRIYAGKLRAWREKDRLEKIDVYHRAERGRLMTDFFADYYFEEDSTLQQLIDRASCMGSCRYCTMSLCWESETAQILLMLRQGRKKEALERLERGIKIHPMEEYAIALRHILEGK